MSMKSAYLSAAISEFQTRLRKLRRQPKDAQCDAEIAFVRREIDRLKAANQ